MSGHPRCAMSKTDQFWQYAREAMLSVGNAKTDEDRRGLLDLARTWTQAALQERERRRSLQCIGWSTINPAMPGQRQGVRPPADAIGNCGAADQQSGEK